MGVSVAKSRIERPKSGTGFYGRLRTKLSIPEIRSDQDLAALVEKRLGTEAIKSLVRSGLRESEVYQLILPRRTLAHRIARQERLSRDESDRVIRVARLTAFAEQVFGEWERAWRWMRKAKRGFNGKAPLELLATEAGARLVEEAISRIDDGLTA